VQRQPDHDALHAVLAHERGHAVEVRARARPRALDGLEQPRAFQSGR
jgi:hypothetical protein